MTLRILIFALVVPIGSPTAMAGYDPLKVPAADPKSLELVVKDERRNRDLPLLAYLPADTKPAPILLFSHGLGGSRHGSAYLGQHWAKRGYVAVFLQHPGSDNEVWEGVPAARRMAALKQAASLQNFSHRVRDVSAVLDQLEKWNQEAGHPLSGRLDLKHVGMSGHSFGAVTTQAVSGQKPGRGLFRLTDDRIKSALIMSPSGPRDGSDPKPAFSEVKIPWLLMTGTHDSDPLGNMPVESRTSVFPALPKGDKFELVLDKAEHSAFVERALAGEKLPRNPNHHKAVLALSTAFWDAYLLQDADAKAWLLGEGPNSVLEKADRWQKK